MRRRSVCGFTPLELPGVIAVVAFLVALLPYAIVTFADEDAPLSGSIALSGPDQKTLTLTAEEFRRLPRTELEARERDGSMAKYSGVEMSQLLNKLGVPQGEGLRGEWLRKFVLVEASDGYRVVFALPEFDAAFSDRKIILADLRNAQPLAESAGPYQVIVPSEKRRARWVRMVTAIRVVDSVAAATDQGQAK